jgi:hypothetical protein
VAHEGIIYAAYIDPALSRVKANGAISVMPKPGPRKRYELEDMRVMRDLFLAAPRETVSDILPFLNAVGVWEAGGAELKLSELQEDEKTIRFVLTGERPPSFATARRWAVAKVNDVVFSKLEKQAMRLNNPEAPTALLELAVLDLRGALYLSTWQDLLEKSPYRYCARSDCPDHNPTKTPFRANRRDQIYCSQYCAHLVSVRNRRAKQGKRKSRR